MLSAVNGPAERSAAYVMSVMIYSSLAGPERPGAWEAVLKVAIYFSLPSGPFSRVTAAAAGPAPARPAGFTHFGKSLHTFPRSIFLELWIIKLL